MLHAKPLWRRDARQRDFSRKALIAGDDPGNIVIADAFDTGAACFTNALCHGRK
jgi:hypothetical protein